MIIIDILDNVHNSKCLNSGKVFLRKRKKKKKKRKKRKEKKKEKNFTLVGVK
jgi:rRNA processing protein Gar1